MKAPIIIPHTPSKFLVPQSLHPPNHKGHRDQDATIFQAGQGFFRRGGKSRTPREQDDPNFLSVPWIENAINFSHVGQITLEPFLMDENKPDHASGPKLAIDRGWGLSLLGNGISEWPLGAITLK
jgi:hypothetical protein